ncbi:hypothetical protein ABW19_dt0203715 [Dactylella cylindrospora]|nr:hypothetical protein ABW19_dt0203715 [Dactylella cylindrospora]
MAQRDLASSQTNRRMLRYLMISADPPSGNDLLNLYKAIINNEEPIKAILERSAENYHFREALLVYPDEMLPKLSHFLRSIKQSIFSRKYWNANTLGLPGVEGANSNIQIPAAFTRYVVLVLANETTQSFDINSSGYQDFVLSVLELYIPLARIATVSLADLRSLFSKFLEMPVEVCMIEKIVSSEAGAGLLKSLLEANSVSSQVFTGESLHLLGNRLARLIRACIASHGVDIEDAVLLWEKMEAIRNSLQEQIREIGRIGKGFSTGSALITTNEAEQEFLHLAHIMIPYNTRTAQNVIQSLQARYFDPIDTMLSSFPCSTCGARLLGILKPHNEIVYDPGRLDDFEDINTPLGAFHLYLSDAAMKDLKTARVGGNLSKVLAVLQKLADGLWELEPDLSRVAETSRAKNDEPILRTAQWCPDGYILWERGIGRSREKTEEWIQIVKVTRIGLRDDVKSAVSAARKAQRIYTKEYGKATAIKIQSPDRLGALIPKIFVGKDGRGLEGNNISFFEPSRGQQKFSLEDALILHKMLCTGKQYTLTKRVAEMITQGGHQAEAPFVVSAEEESIINHFGSSICILGRSGTGKTTCLAFRLLASYIRDQLVNDGKEARQVFLTRSPVLAEKIREYINRLINSHFMRFEIKGDSAENEEDDLDLDIDGDDTSIRSLLDLENQDWPLVCTFDSFATMLERSLR